MKALAILLLFALSARAQVPATPIRRDSVPAQSLPNGGPIPTVRPGNSFYRNPNDPRNVVRATLDNMPIKTPDSSVTYTMPQSGRYGQPQPRAPRKP